MLNETHNIDLTSWVESAQRPSNDFPIQNLPYGAFRRAQSRESFRIGVAIGAEILDMRAAHATGVFSGPEAAAAAATLGPTLNELMALEPPAWSALRRSLSRLLRTGAPEATLLRSCLLAQSEAEYCVPAAIGDYSDFLSSAHHMSNMARIFAPGTAPPPNFMWQPLGYHGRSSSIEVSGTNFTRPRGQTRSPGAEQPEFGPTKRLDYEVELGFYVGQGNRRGQPISIDDADKHIFGLCLLNDWSARDIQGWESNPLGPFLGKSFVTTVSPWVVTLEALAPFRCAASRHEGDPESMSYLESGRDRGHGVDIELEAWIRTTASGDSEMRLSRSSSKHSYWTIAQMLTHHTTGGCNLRSGDLLGTGTQSGPLPGEEGCLIELSDGGRKPVALANGETRAFLQDGDTVTLRGWCERAGLVRIGFGECAGTVLPAQRLRQDRQFGAISEAG